jgi:hypothetical protein
MKPNVKNLGVSISSQRRFLRYWARLLEDDDPRSKRDTSSKRLVVLEYVKLFGDGLKGPKGRMFGVGNDKIAVQVRQSIHTRETQTLSLSISLDSDFADFEFVFNYCSPTGLEVQRFYR